MKPSYEELEQMLEESRREFRSADITMQNLEAKCEKLAAENAGLKDALSAVIDRSNEPDYQSIGMGCGVEDNGLQTDGYNACEYGWREAMDRIYSEVIPDAIPETPAADAFLAEVRASAIDSLVGIKTKQLADMHPDTHAFGATAMSIRSQINELQMFAADIRKGVQS